MKGLALRGKASVCRPLVVQFCAKSPEAFLEAALQVQERGGEHRREGPLSRASVQAPSSLLFEQERCDAVDLNLGCPQSKAMRGPPPPRQFLGVPWKGALCLTLRRWMGWRADGRRELAYRLRDRKTCRLFPFASCTRHLQDPRVCSLAYRSIRTMSEGMLCRTGRWPMQNESRSAL